MVFSKRDGDTADKRALKEVLEAARSLPRAVQYVRNRFNDKLTTAEIAGELGMSLEAVRKELNSSSLINQGAGTPHGNLNTVLWWYHPRANEIPWKDEYKTD
jgi:hypothetical protein